MATAPDAPLKQGKPVSTVVQMHAKWLYLEPRTRERHYWDEMEGLDLLNCLITPIFFASTLSRWPRSFLASVYCCVLALKGYQMALLLLPGARHIKAHSRARYWIILAERVLRQFVATPVLGRGPRFVQWMRDAAAADPGPITAFKLAMLVSGITHAFWNAFCLPLDIMSQVFINVVFFCLHFPPTVTQVAYPIGMLVRHKPRLVWLQWGIEQLACVAVLPLQLLLALVGDAASLLTDGTSALTMWHQPPLQQQQAGMQQQDRDSWAQVGRPPGRAPDLDTPAGRLVLALSMGLMLFVVLYVPLLFAWRLERHLKARYMLTAVQRHASVSSSSSSSTAGATSSGPTSPSSAGPGSCSSSKAVQHPASSSSSTAEFISPGPSFPLFPTVKGVLARHLGAAAGVCFLLGELFVWACTVSPAVAGVLWEQIPGQPT